MKPSLLKRELRHCINKGLTPFIWGEPGIGKSDITKELAREDGRKMFDNRASQMEPIDVRGLPFRDGDTMRWAPPVLFPKSDGSDGPSLLFLDELPQGIHSVQTALFQMVLDRRVGEYTLPDNCVIIAAGNRAQDRSGANRVLQALNNRFIHFDLEVDLEDWCHWAISHSVPNSIIAFIRFRPNLLSAFSPDDKAYPSPRTWEFLGKYIGEGDSLSEETEFESIKGIVGEGAAGEFTSYLRIWRSLPDPDLIIKSPMTADVPSDPAVLYAISTALAARANKDKIGNVLKFVNRLPAEYQVLTVKDSILRNPEVASTKDVIDWAGENTEVVT